MKITSLNVELIRADSAAARFMIRVTLDGFAAGCEVRGQVVGPKCQGMTTVEIAYPLVLVEANETKTTLKGVIPEPNLWTPEAPFLYAVTIEAWVEGRQTDTRTNMIALRGR